MALMNLMTLYQEKNQDIQNFRDQSMAMRKMCYEIVLKAVLTTAQLKKATNKNEEEHHTILFL